jgi:Ca-activated chloride channel family protein
LAESDVKRQDFVLNWQLELGSKPTSAHFTQFVNGSEYGMIVLYPPLPNEQLVLDREVIFVLDTSGSMSGEAIVQAKQALAYAIDDLSTKDKFNIIEFNSNADILWRKAKFADPQNKISAFDFIAKLRANGGTEMHQALSMALLSEADPALFKQILFITDGSVSNEANLMRLIEENLKQARLFTIGIGAAPNSYFMTEAAKSGKGTFTFIGDTKQVKRKMAELMSKINSPALTDIKLNLKGIQQYQQFEMYPNVIGDLYSSDPLVLTYKQPMGMDASFPFSKTEGPMLMGNYNNNAWHFTPQKPVDRSII